MRSLLPLLSVLYVGTKGAEASEHGMPFMEYLDWDNLVCLKWGYNDPLGSITFRLVVNTTGWVGFGFSPNGGMQGADIVMGGLGSGRSYFAVRHYKMIRILKSALSINVSGLIFQRAAVKIIFIRGKCQVFAQP